MIQTWKNNIWNKCDICGKFISFKDFQQNMAIRNLKTPDSDWSFEEYATRCKDHYCDEDLQDS